MDIIPLISPATPLAPPLPSADAPPTGVADFMAQYLGLAQQALETPDDTGVEDVLAPQETDIDVDDAAPVEATQLWADTPPDKGALAANAGESPGARIETMVARWNGMTAAIDETPAPIPQELARLIDPVAEPVRQVSDQPTVERMTPVATAPRHMAGVSAPPAEAQNAQPDTQPLPEHTQPVPEQTAAQGTTAPLPATNQVDLATNRPDLPPEARATAVRPSRISAVEARLSDRSDAAPKITAETGTGQAAAVTTVAPLTSAQRLTAPAAEFAAATDAAPATTEGEAEQLALPEGAGWRETAPNRAESALPMTMARAAEAQAPAVARQIAQAAVSLREGEIELALAPEELGRLRLRITRGDAGAAVTVWFERPEVLEAARRHLDLLMQDLQDSGFESPMLDLRSESDRDSADHADDDAQPVRDMTTITLADEPSRPTRLSDRPLDIRV